MKHAIAVPVPLETEADVRNYFDVVAGARERAVAHQAQKTAAVVTALVRALMDDADQLSPASRSSIANAALVLSAIEKDLAVLVRRRDNRPRRTLS